MQVRKIEKFPFLKWRYCIGINAIAKYAECNIADVVDWIVHCDFPATKTIEGIWVSERSKIREFLKKFNPERTKFDDIPAIKKPKNIKQRRW